MKTGLKERMKAATTVAELETLMAESVGFTYASPKTMRKLSRTFVARFTVLSNTK